jgi:hypothetical protein
MATATSGGSWFSANTLVNHSVPAKALQGQNEAVRNDPNTLVSFYHTIPKEDIALPQFEEWGIARLRSAYLRSELLQLSCLQAPFARTDSAQTCSLAWNGADYESEQEASGLSEFCEQPTGEAHEGNTVDVVSADHSIP